MQCKNMFIHVDKKLPLLFLCAWHNFEIRKFQVGWSTGNKGYFKKVINERKCNGQCNMIIINDKYLF